MDANGASFEALSYQIERFHRNPAN